MNWGLQSININIVSLKTNYWWWRMFFVTIDLFSIVSRIKGKNQRIDKQSEKI